MIEEVCCGSLSAVRSAARRGARRVELCAALEVGGVTPSHGVIRQAVATGVPVQVLIRPRSGDFVYSSAEVDAMCDDIREALSLGTSGVVVGALTPDGDIDLEACRCMMDATEGRGQNTFHRAFDECRAPFQALEEIIQLGFRRILTSGQAPTAVEGIPVLRQLVERAAGRIVILAASGVSPQNRDQIVRETGVTELHGTRL